MNGVDSRRNHDGSPSRSEEVDFECIKFIEILPFRNISYTTNLKYILIFQAILLADIIPCLIAKLTAPFYLQKLSYG